MSRYEFQIKPNIWYGKYSLRKLYNVPFRKVCIVTDKSMVELGMLKPVISILNDLNISYRIFDEVEPDPSLETILSGLSHILVTKPDLLIAVGGGSVIDAAKAIIFFCLRVKEEVIKPDKIVKPFFVAVPTTSGTGSEVTSYSVITDRKNNLKIPLKDKRMLPDVAVLDPIFTSTLPKKVIANAGIDVMTHAVEAYVSREHHEMSDFYALEAASKVSVYLRRMYDDISDDEARMEMHMASCYAGIAFENSGLGLNHGMAHALGAKFKLPHGLANALLMPHIIRYNKSEPIYGVEAEKRYARMAQSMRTSEGMAKGWEDSLINELKSLMKHLELPASIRDCGVEEKAFMEALPDMVKKAMNDFTTGSNPRKATPEDIVKIYISAYYGTEDIPY